MLLIFSRMSADFIRIPYEAARPVPTMTAVGVARPRAQGQAMTKVEIPKSKAKLNRVEVSSSLRPRLLSVSLNVIVNQIIQSRIASKTITGTKIEDILSAYPYIGALVF